MGSERTVAIIAAAGRGERMGGPGNKTFLPLGDRPVLAHALGVFEDCPLVEEVVVAVGEGEEEACRRKVLEPYQLRKVTGVIPGGASRQESVRLALGFIGSSADVLAIHDGARPLLPPGLLVSVVEAGRETGAVVPALPVGDTIKRVSGAGPHARVAETLDRAGLWQVQTPQVFWRDLITLAHEQAAASGYVGTDDAALVERLRQPVYVILGAEENLKVTTPLDLVLARAILDHRARRR